PEGLLAGAQAELMDVLDGTQSTRHVDAYRPVAGLDAAGGIHRILAGKGGLDVYRRKPALRQSRRGNFDEDGLVLSSKQVDFGNARNAQQDVARFLGEGLQFRIGEAVSSDRIKRNVGVAELVVEEWTNDAFRQRLADVADLFAHLIERVLDRIAT